MFFFDQLASRFPAPKLTRGRMAAALLVAAMVDALQIALLPVAWTFVQEFLDVAAMILTVFLLGFHVLLLPTFILEFIPIVDIVPTWTACVIAVVALRKRAQREASTRIPPIVDAPPLPKPRVQITAGSLDHDPEAR
jgi:hypothetical protein